MRDGAAVLIDNKDDGQACVEELAFTLRSRLLHRVKDFLKRDDRDDCRNDVLIIRTAEYRHGYRQRHFGSGANDLRTADDDAAAIHSRQHFADSGVDFFEADNLRLESPVERTV